MPSTGVAAKPPLLLRLVLTAALAALIAMVAPAPADAKPRFGVALDGTHRTVDEWQRMEQGNVGVVRRSLTYRSDVSVYDDLMRDAGNEGLRVLPVVIGTPDGGASPPTSDADLDSYREFLKDLVERYGRGGTFCDTSGNCAPSYEPITDWQIWNEPSLNAFWGNDPNPREYADLLEVARKAIDSRDERGDVILAGMPYNTGTGIPLEKYLKKLYDVNGVKKDFDVATVHPYGRDEDDVRFIMERLRSRLRSEGDGGRAVWITEMGWATDGPSADGAFVKSRSGQARELRKTFGLLQDERKRYDLKTVVWFDWRDSPVPDGKKDRFFYHTGLFEKDGGQKPSWADFTQYTGGSPGSGPLAPTAGPAKASAAPDVLDRGSEDLLPPPADGEPIK